LFLYSTQPLGALDAVHPVVSSYIPWYAALFLQSDSLVVSSQVLKDFITHSQSPRFWWHAQFTLSDPHFLSFGTLQYEVPESGVTH